MIIHLHCTGWMSGFCSFVVPVVCEAVGTVLGCLEPGSTRWRVVDAHTPKWINAGALLITLLIGKMASLLNLIPVADILIVRLRLLYSRSSSVLLLL